MTSRRDFLKALGTLGLVAASPKFIFDLGANKFKDKDIDWSAGWYVGDPILVVSPEYENALYEEVFITHSDFYTTGIFERAPTLKNELVFPKRFTLDKTGELREVLPFKLL